MYAIESSRARSSSSAAHFPYSGESEATSHHVPNNDHLSRLDFYSSPGSSREINPSIGRFTNPTPDGRYESTGSTSFDRSLYRAPPPPIHVGTELHYSVTPEEFSSATLPPIRRGEISSENVSHIGNLRTENRSEPNSALSVPSPILSGDSDPWSPAYRNNTVQSPRQRKPRREKPRIALAPDQPPTTQGKPRARVYVACVQCRTRKIRCDGAKPTCHNCGRRVNGSNECSYDAVPKRRGPDKVAGARQRMAREVRNGIEGTVSRRRRRRVDSDSQSPLDLRHDSPNPARAHGITPGPRSYPSSPDVSHSPEEFPSALSIMHTSDPSYPGECLCHGLAHCPDNINAPAPPYSSAKTVSESFDNHFVLMEAASFPEPVSSAYVTQVDDSGSEGSQGEAADIHGQPSLDFTRKTWWDSLISLYLSPDSQRLQSLTTSQRDLAAHQISSDLRFLFKTSNYWFSFFHIQSFFGNFYDPIRRERIQPSLVLALLAVSTFWQSSEVGLGRAGRERALCFRDEAQSAMEASFNAGWIDETLAQTAWLLTLFEHSAHPYHSTERSLSCIAMLDSIIRSLSLTLMDADDPNTSIFSLGTVPTVPRETEGRSAELGPRLARGGSPGLSSAFSRHDSSPPAGGCSCASLTLGEHWPAAAEYVPMWGSTPAWNSAWSEAEIRKESCRRLCWSSIMIAAGHVSYTTAHRTHTPDLFIAEPANCALLFSGESITHHFAKDTIWALHDRSLLLWHGCIKMRSRNVATDAEKAQFALKAWLEADALEAALNSHTCGIERTFIFVSREYIFNTRMFISHEFQRFIPLVTADVNGLFHRKKAEEWLTHQATVAQRFMYGLRAVTGNSNNVLARRPFFLFWFMGQVSRALSLWQCDNSLDVALDVCKAFLPPIDYLTALWPCAEQRHRYERLRVRLDSACYAAGVIPPPPPNLTLPTPSSPGGLL